MNPQSIFLQHFTQCHDSEAEFHVNGTPYKGAWPEAEFHVNGTPYKGAWPERASMPMFLKDLIEEAEDENREHEESLESLKTEIKNLEADLKDARKENGE